MQIFHPGNLNACPDSVTVKVGHCSYIMIDLTANEILYLIG